MIDALLAKLAEIAEIEFADGIMQNMTFGKVSRHFLIISMTV